MGQELPSRQSDSVREILLSEIFLLKIRISVNQKVMEDPTTRSIAPQMCMLHAVNS